MKIGKELDPSDILSDVCVIELNSLGSNALRSASQGARKADLLFLVPLVCVCVSE